MKAITKIDIYEPIWGFLMIPAGSLIYVDHESGYGYCEGICFSIRPGDYYPYKPFGTFTKEYAINEFERDELYGTY